MNSLYEELRFYTSADVLVDHWLDLLAPDQTCPFKKDFAPMLMGRHLPDVFLAEWLDDNHIMIRVAGSRTTDVTREDGTGKNMLDICLPEHREPLREFYGKMRTGLYAGVTEHALSLTSLPSAAKGLQLPLLDENSEARFFVGVTKVEPMQKNQQDFRRKTEKSAVSLNMWFTNLSVQGVSTNSKIG